MPQIKSSGFSRTSVWLSIFAASGIVGILLSLRPTAPRSQTVQPDRNSRPDLAAAKAIEVQVRQPVHFSLPSDLSDENLLLWAQGNISNAAQVLAWAESQTDEKLRERLIGFLLQAWAEQNPRAALDWALAQDKAVRYMRLESTLAGVVSNPAQALEIGRELLARDPDNTNGFGSAIVSALTAAGHFETAFQFAKENAANAESDWFKTTFQRWAAVDPGAAIKALDSINDPALRNAAFQSLVTGWADHDYSSLADFATTLPVGDQRTLALDTAMSQWCLQDPATLGEWLNNQRASPELDKTIAALITRTDTENRSSEVAMSWLEGISDAKLRHDALLHVMREWTAADAAAAWKYFNAIAWLDNNDRTTVRKELEIAPQTPASAD